MLADLEGHRFLSRLSGGEHPSLAANVRKVFLSRLSGGEHPSFSQPTRTPFLSRLSGGERG